MPLHGKPQEPAPKQTRAAANPGDAPPADSYRPRKINGIPDALPNHASNQPAAEPAGTGDASMGTLLEPVLRRACDGRLSTVNWFRVAWQRRGALTGYASYRDDAGHSNPVVVKLPVPPCERLWLVRLDPFADIVPRVYAHGDALEDYDLAWVVLEHLPHGPLGSAWQGREFDLLVEAIGRFYSASNQFPRHGEPQFKDWDTIFHQARQSVHDRSLAEAQRWNKALKKAHRKLKQWVATWQDRPVDHWCHGDLHLANAMTRHPAPEGPALLLDFAHTRVGNWIEDAIYLEHLYWGRPHRLNGRKLTTQIAQQRKQVGLGVDRDWARLAEVRRALLAMSTPAMLRHNGEPQHVHAALEVLERAVG